MEFEETIAIDSVGCQLVVYRTLECRLIEGLFEGRFSRMPVERNLVECRPADRSFNLDARDHRGR